MEYAGHRGTTRGDGSTADSWKRFTCGHCGHKVEGAIVAKPTQGGSLAWLWCPSCAEGSVFDSADRQYPGVATGPSIEGLPPEVQAAYQEARQCVSVNSYTACELLCRKILMHVGVDKGAKEGLEFAAYLSYLEKAGYVTPPMKPWVELIRRHGNQATHRLERPSKERAEGTLMFTAELLRLTYEMEHIVARYSPAPAESADG